MSSSPLRILIIGAHPDDADYKAGGTAALWRSAGHVVKMVSVTDGGAGHQTLRGRELVLRRRAEAAAAGAVIGAEYITLDHPDGALLPDLNARHAMIRLIRNFKPDLVLTHRLNDYHPDHRYTSLLVQDSAFLVTVPAVCPDTPHLSVNPIFAYLSDHFTKPYPFTPAVAVDVGPVFDMITEMLHQHTSQFYEWLPYNLGHLQDVPAAAAERKAWLGRQLRGIIRPLADRHRDFLVKTYGAQRGGKMEYIEAFEAGEYGSPLTADAIGRLFPFAR